MHLFLPVAPMGYLRQSFCQTTNPATHLSVAPMLTLNKIVHPTDFSGNSNHALALAATIARQAGSKIMLAHVYTKPYLSEAYAGSIRTVVDAMEDEKVHKAIHEEIEALASSDIVKGVPLSRRLFHDIPAYKLIQELGDDADAGLVVIGASGAHTLLHGGVLGTNTERIMRHSHLPVLIVPGTAPNTGFKRVLFISDFKHDTGEFFPYVLNMAKLFDAEVLVGHINTSSTFTSTAFAEEKFAALKSEHPYEKLSLVVHNDEDVVDAVQHLVRNYDIDLLAMPTYGRRGIAAMFFGSVAEELAGSLNIPMLSYKTPKKK